MSGIRSFIVFSTLMLPQSSWAGPLVVEDGRSPYGIWSTERGDLIVITRDDQYTYCSRDTCTRGLVRKEGAFGVTLVGFMTDRTTKLLRDQSGETALREGAGSSSSDFDFTEQGLGMAHDRRSRLCGDRPCVCIGNLELGVTRFVKLESF
jgi:hypothetical protein